ncbi:hypothetical protein ASD23_14455 [Agromyces sp. Root1464]|uniref:hypothetical protein n=1 Tax=Agromyces sp. Root1464 TaxID=1736467 RepID=UPI0006FBC892|nr:hypothetical protein [Agromyces sp. Root1464]KQZ09437.1 hypothetical protein ASD23_14455 [Agromyces sp. Root1464]
MPETVKVFSTAGSTSVEGDTVSTGSATGSGGVGCAIVIGENASSERSVTDSPCAAEVAAT